MTNILTTIGIFLSLYSTFLYIYSIYRGKTKPHLYTHLIWAIVTNIAFIGALVSGGGIGSWVMGSSAILTIFVASLSVKYGTKNITKQDTIFLILALLAIIPWLIFKNPFWSVVLAVIIDLCGYFPTIRKAWLYPKTEEYLPWLIGSIRAGISIFALNVLSVETALLSFEILIMNFIVVLIILLRESK